MPLGGETGLLAFLTVATELITNVAIVVVGFKITRHLSRMELKVDLMWSRFSRLFDIRAEDKRRAEE